MTVKLEAVTKESEMTNNACNQRAAFIFLLLSFRYTYIQTLHILQSGVENENDRLC